MAREPWWRATIWIDVLGFGPFYAFAIYAFVKGATSSASPALMWAGVMFTNVTIILFEELLGAHATPRPGVVIAANAAVAVDAAAGGRARLGRARASCSRES